MIPYDRSKPLIAIHVPKTGGTSVRRIFAGWFGDGLLQHNYIEATATMPPRRDLAALHRPDRPVCVWGHFNMRRGFGIPDYYPEVRQFVTILRDPFETALSTYYFTRRVGHRWKDSASVPQGDIEDWLMSAKPNILNHFPRPITPENYRETIDGSFVAIGIIERLAESVDRIAQALGFPFDPASLTHENATPRERALDPSLRDAYAARHPLEFEVYDYVRARFG